MPNIAVLLPKNQLEQPASSIGNGLTILRRLLEECEAQRNK